MAAPRGMRPLGWLLALLARARADMLVTSGPPEIVGLSLIAPPHAFSAQHFDVSGRVVLARDHEWACGERRGQLKCDTRYVGKAPLTGLVVILPEVCVWNCGAETVARGAHAAGAALVATFFVASARSALLGLRLEPGFDWRFFFVGDERALAAPPSVTLTQAAGLPLLDALARPDAAEVRVRVTPSANAWRRFNDGPPWVLWQLALSAQTAYVLECALCRLLAFIQHDGGLAPTVPQLVLALELALNSVRLCFFALDPIGTRGLLPLQVLSLLTSVHMPFAAVTTALVLAYFSAAAAARGLASPRLPRWYARLVVACALLSFGLDIPLSVLAACFQLRSVVADSLRLALSFGPHALLLGLTFVAERRLRAALATSNQPPLLIERLCGRVRASIRWQLLFLCAGPVAVQPCCFHARWPRLVLTGAVSVGVLSCSYVQVTVFVPRARVPIGPLQAAGAALACALERVRSAASERVALAYGRLREGGGAGGARLGARHPSHAPSRTGSQVLSAGSAELHGLQPHLLLGVSLPYLRELQAELAGPGGPPPGRERGGVDDSVGPGGPPGPEGAAAPWREEGGVDRARRADGASGGSAASARRRKGVRGALGEVSGRAAPSVSTRAVAERVKALTSASGLSLCEERLRARTAVDGRRAVGPANLFVSHAQACDFGRLIDAVEASQRLHGVPEKEWGRTFVWIDVFSFRQNAVETDLAFLGQLLAWLGRVVMVLDPWDQPLCLTRVWCLFELVQCLSPDVQLELTLCDREQRRFSAALAREPRKRIEARLTSFDAAKAQAFLEADRRAIMELIEARPGGVAQFNADTHAVVRQALAAFSWLTDHAQHGGSGDDDDGDTITIRGDNDNGGGGDDDHDGSGAGGDEDDANGAAGDSGGDEHHRLPAQTMYYDAEESSSVM